MRAFYRICSAWYYGESLFVDVLSNGDAFEQKEKSKRYTTDRGKITKNCKTESCSTGECTAGNKEKVTAQESATQETEIARQTVENTEQKMELSIWKFIIRAEIFCALYACSDEFHQYFVPGRSCKFFDVCVDSTGTFFGALLFWGIFHLREQKRERKRQEISKKSKS